METMFEGKQKEEITGQIKQIPSQIPQQPEEHKYWLVIWLISFVME